MLKKPKELNGLLIYSGLSTMKRGGVSGVSVRGSLISVLDLKLQAKASFPADARSLSWSQTKHSRCFRLLSSLAFVTFFALASLARAESPHTCGIPLNSARIVFDSNRSGSFGIYSARLDGTEIRSIVDSPADEVHPEVSPDGRHILFATHPRTDVKKGMKQGSLWIVGSDGTNLRQIVARGNFPTFGNGGRQIVFERNRRRVFTANLDGSKEAEIFPGDRDFPFEVVMPRLSPDEKSIAFTSDKGGKWNSWI
ncbi:MAG: PD40 domain-containing protein, partial [Deltaproteobacteria bacterium]|nr:PD40 domain-containing protein [Deltaproteobacteria bacterium]